MNLKHTCWLLLLSPMLLQAQSPASRLKVSDDIELIRLSENIFVHVSVSDIEGSGRVSSNGFILVNQGAAFLFDTPATNAQTETLVTWITDSLRASVVAFMPNHWHADCMGGLEMIHEKGIGSYSTQMTMNIATARGLPAPQQSFLDSLSFGLNGITTKCYFFGAGHSTDNIVVWIPTEKILFAGCMVKSIESQNLGNLSDAVMEEWPVTIRKVIDYFPSVEIVIPGHGALGGKELLTHTLELLEKAPPVTLVGPKN